MSYTLNPILKNKTENGYITINYKDIEQLFDMTIENACKHLGISKTSLKKICRHFKISKWPYKRSMKKPETYANIQEELYNDLSFLTGYNITENPYTLEQILYIHF